LFLDKLTFFHSEVDGCKPLQTPRVALELGKINDMLGKL
jgi:hypothetical protein